MTAAQCSPLCGASNAYGRYDQPWKHEPQCSVRIAWRQERRSSRDRPNPPAGLSKENT